jgi:hypothetical protein
MKIEVRPPDGPLGPAVRPALLLIGDILGSDRDTLIEAVTSLGPGDVTLNFDSARSLGQGGVATLLAAADAVEGLGYLYLQVGDGPIRDGLKLFRFPPHVRFAEY